MQKKRSAGTLTWLLIAMYIAVAVPLLFGINALNRRELLTQNARSVQLSMESFAGDLETSMGLIEAYLLNLVSTSPEVRSLEQTSDEITRYEALTSVSAQLDHIVQLIKSIDGVWLCSPNGDEVELITRSAYHGNSLVRQGDIRAAILDAVRDDAPSPMRAWSSIVANGQPCLLYVQRIGGVSCGAWLDHTYLQRQIEAIPFAVEPVELQLTDAGESAESGWRTVDGRIEIETPLRFCALSLRASFDADELARSDGFPVYLSFFAGLVLYSALIFSVLHFRLDRPLHRLISDIQIIRGGDFRHRVRVSTAFTGMTELCETINMLLDNLDTLKISIYEEQLDRQNIECQYLQIQLKTHFFLNCLNIIHAMARLGNTDLIQRLTEHLVSYLRYIQDDSGKLVTLEVELEQVKNYAMIQQLRFPNLFEYECDVAPEVLSEEIPPLLIQTFIENTVEHAMRRGNLTHVRVEAHYQDRGEQLGLHIQIADNGIGFTPEVLRALLGNETALEHNGHRSIGIFNIKNRLRLQYGGRAELRISNRAGGGASIAIWLPIDVPEEESDVFPVVRG